MIGCFSALLSLTIITASFSFLTFMDQAIFQATQKWDDLEGRSVRSELGFKEWLLSPSELPPRSDYQRGGSRLFCEMQSDLHVALELGVDEQCEY